MYQDDKIKNVSFSQPHVKWQFYCTEDFTKGQCNATSLCWYQCSSDRDVSVSCQQTHEHFIQVFNVIQLFTPPAPCPAPAQCEYNLVSHETWKLAWLAPAPARLGGSARLGAGSCCLGWKLSSPRLASLRSSQLKLLPRCGSDLVTNMITELATIFSTWSDNLSVEHFLTVGIFINLMFFCAWVSSTLPAQKLVTYTVACGAIPIASPGPGSVSRLESGKISCSRSSQQLSNDVAHLAVMKHF